MCRYECGNEVYFSNFIWNTVVTGGLLDGLERRRRGSYVELCENALSSTAAHCHTVAGGIVMENRREKVELDVC